MSRRERWEDEWDAFSVLSDESYERMKADNDREFDDDIVNGSDNDDDEVEQSEIVAPGPNEDEFVTESQNDNGDAEVEDEEENEQEEVELDEKYYFSDEEDDESQSDNSESGSDKSGESDSSKWSSRTKKDDESDRSSSMSYTSETNNVAEFFYDLMNVEMSTFEGGIAQLSFGGMVIRTYKIPINCKGLQLRFDIGKDANFTKTIDDEMFKIDLTYPDSGTFSWIEITFNPSSTMKTTQIYCEVDENIGRLFINLPDNLYLK